MSEGSDLVHLTDRRIGTVLRGKYRLDRVLGVGGMAVVYAATHRNKKRFAVKMLHPELSIRQDIRTRFLREGYVANSVEHPGAVAVLDDDIAEDGAAFLVMELLDGSSVEQLRERRGNRLSVRVVFALTYQLLDVLAAAHAKSVVHRDIKPANVFLTRDGALKVLDFGIARLRDATSEQATQTGLLMGTPAFMAPEQALGQSSQIDGQTDIWALGATMFSLLSGSNVHVGDNPQMLMIRAATQQARSLASVAGDVPALIVAVVDRALAFDKAHRWPSAAAMRDAVRDAYVAVHSSAPSLAPLAGLFASDETGRVDNFYADAVASTPVAESVAVSITLTHLSGGGPLSPSRGTATPVVMTATSTPAHRGRMIGGTTSQPISSDRSGEDSVKLPRSFATRIGVLAVAMVALLGIGAFVVANASGEKSAEAPKAESSSPSPSATPITIVATPSVSTATLGLFSFEPVGMLAGQPSTMAAGKRMPGGARPVPPQNLAAAPPHPSKNTPGQPAPAASAAIPMCRVVPYFDSDGNKRFKQDCQ